MAEALTQGSSMTMLDIMVASAREMDPSDLRELLRERRSIAEIAEFLCREVEEVEAKAAELQ